MFQSNKNKKEKIYGTDNFFAAKLTKKVARTAQKLIGA